MGGGGRGRAIFRHRLWLLLLGIGLVSSALGIVVDACVGLARDWRHSLLASVDSPATRLVLWMAWSVAATCLAVIVSSGSAEAQGSGIPQMKVILAGGMSASRSESYLSVRCLCTKCVGLVLGKAGGLSIGKEGPWVHISAALAHNFSRLSLFAHLGLEKEHWREIISAGFAAGTAANFGAPIGGVLFSIEVTATHYPVSSYLKAFVCSVSGAFCFRFFGGTGTGPWSKYNGGALFSSVDEDGDIKVFQHERHELLAFSVLGVIAGLLGSGFVALHRLILVHKRERYAYSGRFVEPVCVAAVVALLTFPDLMGDFMYMGDNALVEDMLSTRDLHESQHVNGQHWGSGGLSGTTALTADLTSPSMEPTASPQTGPVTEEQAQVVATYAAARVPHALATLIVVRFFLTAMCITLPIPCGVFMPVFVVGCALGRLYGYYVSIFFSSDWWTQGTAQRAVLAGSYAVAGGAAFSAGVTRAVSTAVFVFEMTGQLHQLVPVLLAVIIAIGVGNLHTPSIYNSLLELNKLPYFYSLPSAMAASAGGRPWGATQRTVVDVPVELTYGAMGGPTPRRKRAIGAGAAGLTAADLMSRLVEAAVREDEEDLGRDSPAAAGRKEGLRLDYESLPLRPTAAQVTAVVNHGVLPSVAIVSCEPRPAGSSSVVLLGAISRMDLGKVAASADAGDDDVEDGQEEDNPLMSLAGAGGGSGGGVGRVRQLLQGTALHSVASHTSVGQLQLYFSRLGVELAYVVSSGQLRGVITSQQVALQPPD